MQVQNLDNLRDSTTIKISSNDGEELWISTIDLEYAFGQVELDEDTAKHCVVAIVGGENTGHYRFKRGFYGLADMPVVFQKRLDKLLQRNVLAWQDDMLIVTGGNMEQHYTEVTEVLAKLQEAGYKPSFKKSEFFKKSVEWSGYDISDAGIKPEASRVEAIQKLQEPKTLSQVRSFLGSKQYLSKYVPNLSEKREPLRNLLQNELRWNWGDTENTTFEKLKAEVQNIEPLKHYNKNEAIILM